MVKNIISDNKVKDAEYKQNGFRANTPLMETKISKSADGKYIIHKVIITTIKPTAYYKAVAD